MFLALAYLIVRVPVRVLERVDGLLELAARGAHIHDHDCFATAAQGVLQQPGQLRILRK